MTDPWRCQFTSTTRTVIIWSFAFVAANRWANASATRFSKHCNMKKAMTFYSEALGSGVPIASGNEMLIPAQNGQMIGLVEVEKLSDRSKKHGRGCHMAMDVPQDDFDSMVALVERYGGKTQGDRRAEDGLRPLGERSIYFFDPDNNRLQITAHAPNQVEELLSDQEKWRRIVASRKAQGRGLSRWESGGKKVI